MRKPLETCESVGPWSVGAPTVPSVGAPTLGDLKDGGKLASRRLARLPNKNPTALSIASWAGRAARKSGSRKRLSQAARASRVQKSPRELTKAQPDWLIPFSGRRAKAACESGVCKWRVRVAITPGAHHRRPKLARRVSAKDPRTASLPALPSCRRRVLGQPALDDLLDEVRDLCL